jgi:hypothetical protein
LNSFISSQIVNPCIIVEVWSLMLETNQWTITQNQWVIFQIISKFRTEIVSKSGTLSL